MLKAAVDLQIGDRVRDETSRGNRRYPVEGVRLVKEGAGRGLVEIRVRGRGTWHYKPWEMLDVDQ